MGGCCLLVSAQTVSRCPFVLYVVPHVRNVVLLVGDFSLERTPGTVLSPWLLLLSAGEVPH